MKKLLSLLVTIAMLASITTVSLAEDLPELTYLRWDSDPYTEEEWAVIEEEIGAKVNVMVVPFDDYYSKLNTLIAAGETPDVFEISEYLAVEWGKKGVSMELSQPYEDRGVNLEDTYIAACLYGDEGNVYGITAGVTAILLFYNKDLFDAYDVPYPSSDPENPITWEEYVQTAQKLTRDSNGLCPLDEGFDTWDVTSYGTLTTTWTFSLTAFLYSANSGFFTSDGMGLDLGSDGAQKVLTEMSKLSTEYLCAPDSIISSSLPGNVQMFKDGMLAMAVEGSFMIGSYVTEGANFGIAPLPVFDTPATATWSAAYAISADTELADASLSLLEIIVGDTGSQYPSKIEDYEGENYDAWASALGLSESDQEWMKGYLNSSAAKVHEAVYVKNYSKILDEVISPEMSNLWAGDATPEQVASVTNEKSIGMFEGAYELLAN